jgi:predicted O-linked N-acetylglucosamine transferase (SPINDLY family)
MPDNGIVFNDHGVLMQQQHRNAEAIMLFLKGIQVDPKHRQLYVNLGNSLQNHGRALDAVEMYQHALQHCGDNPNLRSNLLFCLNYISSLTRETVFAEHQAFRPLLKTKPLAAVKARDLDPHRRLRIGYVSADFKRHSCARFFEPVLFGHNRNRMEVTLYSNVDVGDTTTERFKQAADRWRDVKSMDDHEAAEQIRDDGIDILVEMNGHTSGHRLSLFALKPAPVQISWLGYPNTTGVPEIDYRLSDEITDPSGEADAYSTERIVRMPNGFHCFAPEFPGIPVSPSPCLDNRHVTFGSFNYLAKIGDPVIDAWTQILDRIPNSRLVMKARGLSDLLCRDTYLEHFEARGIDRQRIDIVPYTPRTEDHLALYGRIDIALDPFPYNGTTTTCEAMWMGVPVVALLGESHAARVSASLMTRVGLEPLVGADILDYVERAVELASDTNRLAQLRQDIRPAMTASPLMDAAGFVRDLEAVYRDVWEAYCSRESA